MVLRAVSPRFFALLAGSPIANRLEGRFQANHGPNPKSSTVDQAEEDVRISMGV